jgi:hypothetical protein
MRTRVFKNRVLKGIFGPKREEDKSWRKLHNVEPHSLYSSPNIVRVIKSRKMRWVGHVAYMRECRGVYRVMVGEAQREETSGKTMPKWKDNIKMDLREIRINGANWIWLAQERVCWQVFVSMVMNLSRFHKERRLLFDKLSDYRLFKEYPAPWSE